MSESLLEKYPHLKLLTKLKKPPVLPLPTPAPAQSDENENTLSSLPSSGRISLLGPGVGSRSPLVPLHPPPPPGHIPHKKVFAEDLFAASVAADDDQWLQFQVEEAVPAKQQLDQLKMWLMANSPSTVTRSSGVGWIAVKFKDKGKKVLEAKAAWDSYEGEKTMEVVNNLADEFNVKGGKWLCHLPTSMIDQVWSKLATTLMCGGLGPSVYMVKVSPVQDVQPEQSRGEHVICVYNMDYKDTEQVMRVENLMRSAGVTTILTYKPDIFSALGIYRNNKWGFRPTIYSSRVMLMEGKSRVETVGTNKWYYNTSKGLQYPAEGKEGSGGVNKGEGKDNEVKNVDESKTKKLDKSPDKGGEVTKFSMGRIEDLKTVGKVEEAALPPSVGKSQLQVASVEDMESTFPSKKSDAKVVDKSSVFCMEDMEAMKKSKVGGGVDHKVDSDKKKAAVKNALKSKKKDIQEKEVKSTDLPERQTPESERNLHVVEKLMDFVNDEGKDIISDKKVAGKVTKPNNEKAGKKPEKQKPAWLLKLEQLQLKSLDEMANTG